MYYKITLNKQKICLSNHLKAHAKLKSTFLWHLTHATNKECNLFYSWISVETKLNPSKMKWSSSALVHKREFMKYDGLQNQNLKSFLNSVLNGVQPCLWLADYHCAEYSTSMIIHKHCHCVSLLGTWMSMQPAMLWHYQCSSSGQLQVSPHRSLHRSVCGFFLQEGAVCLPPTRLIGSQSADIQGAVHVSLTPAMKFGLRLTGHIHSGVKPLGCTQIG